MNGTPAIGARPPGPTGLATKLEKALDERRQPIESLGTIVIGVCLLVAAYIAAAILGTSGAPEYHFVEERGAITALSAIFLAMSAGFAFATALASLDRGTQTRLLWFGVAAAMTLLAIDELMEFHEMIGGRLDDADTAALARNAGWRGWNDIIVVAYGLIALPFGIVFLPTLLRYPRLLELLAVAFVLFVVHTAIDSLVEPRTTVSAILEESAKLYCTSFFALAFLAALLHTTRPKPD